MRRYDYDEDPDEFVESEMDDEGHLIDGVGFADPGGGSALRAETEDNPRIYPCPNCGGTQSPNPHRPYEGLPV